MLNQAFFKILCPVGYKSCVWHYRPAYNPDYPDYMLLSTGSSNKILFFVSSPLQEKRNRLEYRFQLQAKADRTVYF